MTHLAAGSRAIRDQFGGGAEGDVTRAQVCLQGIGDAYRRAYYEGVVNQRKAKSVLNRGDVHSRAIAYEWLRKAMDSFEEAEAIRPSGNEDAILRRNSCVRLIGKYRPSHMDEPVAAIELE